STSSGGKINHKGSKNFILRRSGSSAESRKFYFKMAAFCRKPHLEIHRLQHVLRHRGVAGAATQLPAVAGEMVLLQLPSYLCVVHARALRRLVSFVTGLVVRLA